MRSRSGDLRQTVLRLRALRRETVRREIVRQGGVGLLASHVLGYDVRPFHQEMIDFQGAAPDTCLQLAPRGYGKSTILTITRVIFEILKNPNIRILISSNTQIQAEVFLREIKAHFEKNDRLKEYFGNFASEDKWDTREIVVGPRTSTAKESTITCVGVGGPVASRHYDLIIADDLVDEENARTETQRERVKTWWYQTLLPCLEPDGRLFVIGTRYHHLDLYGHLIRNEYAEKHQIIRAIAPDGATPWPEKFSLEWLEEHRRQAGSIIFNAQYQNDTSLMKGHIFREEWFRFYDEEPNWAEMHHFIGCDPAATKREAIISAGRSDTDWWTIVVGARPFKEQKYASEVYVREIWRGRCTKEEYLDKLKQLNQKYKPLKVMIETVAAQEYLAQDAEKHMPVRRMERTTDKVARAYWLQAFLENGQILLPAKHIAHGPWVDWQALMDELLLFPQGEHDDFFDGLQTMMEGAMSVVSGGDCGAFVVPSLRERWEAEERWNSLRSFRRGSW
ncbi:MAG TPA: phage terminase large subunit [Candidatus Krumholzibacteria bacterium]|nr:phage terminase large subunit [Candidatus Krumholzibacteria bacterium]